MAENNAEISTQPSLLRRISGRKTKEQPTAITTSSTSQKPEVVTPGEEPTLVRLAKEGRFPTKDYTVRENPSKPSEVLGKL